MLFKNCRNLGLNWNFAVQNDDDIMPRDVMLIIEYIL